jgi:hypothetical protein
VIGTPSAKARLQGSFNPQVWGHVSLGPEDLHIADTPTATEITPQMKVATTPLKVPQSLDQNRYFGLADANLESHPAHLEILKCDVHEIKCGDG